MTRKIKSSGRPGDALITTSPGASEGHAFQRLGGGAVLMDGENPIAFQMLIDGLDAEFRPQGPMAILLIDYAAALLWRLRRVATFEAGLLTWIAAQQCQRHDRKGISLGDVFLSGDANGLPQPGRNASDLHRQRHSRQSIGRTLEAALDEADPLGKIGRYEGHLMRQLHRTLDQLRRLRSEPHFDRKEHALPGNIGASSLDPRPSSTPTRNRPQSDPS